MHTQNAISCELLSVQPELVSINILSMNHWNLTVRPAATNMSQR